MKHADTTHTDCLNLRLNSLALTQDEKPETAWEEKEDRHHEVKSWQRHLTSGQVISTVIFFDLQL
jgi:hypothetical protein